MGVVYAGRHTELGREAAIKLLLEGKEGADASERFQRECEAVARLGEHPGIVRVYDSGVHQGRPYLSLELVKGAALDETLARSGPWETAAALELGIQLCEAMEFAHQAGILHRDLKPANVLLDESGRPRITDFGLAKNVNAKSMTATGALLGTPAYMPPEQASGDRDQVGPRSDVYGLGATLFTVLTGSPPFQGATLANTLTQIFTKPPPAPSSLRPDLDPAIDQLILRCLAKAPADRFASAAELAAALQAVLDGSAPPPPRSLTGPLLGLAALILLVPVGALLVLGAQGSEAATPTPTVSLDPRVQSRARAALRKAQTEGELRAWLAERSAEAPESRARALSRLADVTWKAFERDHDAAKGGDNFPPTGEVSRVVRHRTLRAWAREHLVHASRTPSRNARQELGSLSDSTRFLARFVRPKKNQYARFRSDRELQLFGGGSPNLSIDLVTGRVRERQLLPRATSVYRVGFEGSDVWALEERDLSCAGEETTLQARFPEGLVGRDFLLLEDALLVVGSRPQATLKGSDTRRGFVALVPRGAFKAERGKELDPKIEILEQMALCVVRHPTLPTFYVGGGAWQAAEGHEYVAQLTREGDRLRIVDDHPLFATAEVIAVAPDGKALAIGLNRDGGRIYPLDPTTGAIDPARYTTLIPSGLGHDPVVQVRGVAFLPDGRLLTTTTIYDIGEVTGNQMDKRKTEEEYQRSQLSLWSVSDQRAYRTEAQHNVAKTHARPLWIRDFDFRARVIELSPDGSLLAVGTESKQVVLLPGPSAEEKPN